MFVELGSSLAIKHTVLQKIKSNYYCYRPKAYKMKTHLWSLDKIDKSVNIYPKVAILSHFLQF